MDESDARSTKQSLIFASSVSTAVIIIGIAVLAGLVIRSGVSQKHYSRRAAHAAE
jgi:hypothetical protein